MHTDKVYLIKYTSNDDAAKFYRRIEEELEQNYKHIQAKYVLLDTWDLYECVEKFREIILQEMVGTPLE